MSSSYCPRLKHMNHSILSLPPYQHLKDILKIDNFNITQTKEARIISFNQFSLYSQYNNSYKITFKFDDTYTDLLSLLYLVKYTSPRLYEKKMLLYTNIYQDFIQEKLYYDNVIKEKEQILKGGVYAIQNVVIDNTECYLVGGWVFAVYKKNEISYRNIINNASDNITALTVIKGENENEQFRIVTGDRNGNVKLWKVISFHLIQFVDCELRKFSQIRGMYTFQDKSNRIGIFDAHKFEVWSKWNEKFYIYESEDNEEILCSTYNWDEKKKRSSIIFVNKKKYISFFYFQQSSKEPYIIKVYNDNDKPISSLKFYNDRSTLFAGNTILVQVWDCSMDNNYFLAGVHFLDDTIIYLEYFLYKKVLYLFCGGKKTLHLLHFSA